MPNLEILPFTLVALNGMQNAVEEVRHESDINLNVQLSALSLWLRCSMSLTHAKMDLQS